MRRATRRAFWLLIGSTLLWLASLSVAVTRFGASSTLTLEEGFLGVYWGGDAECRNSAVDNHFSEPWNPGRGVGRCFPGGVVWAV
jgi:hypothetical protein